jgi:hypothetical protein
MVYLSELYGTPGASHFILAGMLLHSGGPPYVQNRIAGTIYIGDLLSIWVHVCTPYVHMQDKDISIQIRTSMDNNRVQ